MNPNPAAYSVRKKLASSGIKVNHDPYQLVAENKMAKLLELLQKEGEDRLDVNMMRWSGFSLLHRAAGLGNTDMCSLLVQFGANVNQRSTFGWYTPLHLALANGWEETAFFFWMQVRGARYFRKRRKTAVLLLTRGALSNWHKSSSQKCKSLRLREPFWNEKRGWQKKKGDGCRCLRQFPRK